MKTLFVLASLFVVLVIGLSYNSIAYGDHPDPVELTFNQESYEFGDTIIATVKLVEPYNLSADPEVYLRFESGSGLGLISGYANSAGYAEIKIPLTQLEMKKGTWKLTAAFMEYQYNKNGIPVASFWHGDKLYHITINSDRTSTIMQHMDTLKILNNTSTETSKEIGFIQSTLTHLDNVLITMSQISHDLQDDVKGTQTSTNGFARILDDIRQVVDIINIQTANLAEEIQSLKDEMKELKKQSNNHANNGTKHHSHP